VNESVNLEIVKQAYEAFAHGDMATLSSLQRSDVVFESPGSSDIPWAGTFRGPTETCRFFAAIAEEAEILCFEPRTFLAHADQVVVLGFERFRTRRTGRVCDNHWVHAYRFAEGRIVGLREYGDTAALAAAFRPPSSA
jgi:ketosteroid isomerase-like protein